MNKLFSTILLGCLFQLLAANSYNPVPPYSTKSYNSKYDLNAGRTIFHNGTFYSVIGYGSTNEIHVLPFIQDYENKDQWGYPYLKKLPTFILQASITHPDIRLFHWGNALCVIEFTTGGLYDGLSVFSRLVDTNHTPEMLQYDDKCKFGKITVDLPGHPDADHWDRATNAQEYEGHLYMLVEGSASGDDKWYFIRTKEDTFVNKPTWEFYDYLRDNAGNVVSHGSDDVYDLLTVMGVENGRPKQRLIVGRSHSSKVSLYEFKEGTKEPSGNYTGNWHVYEQPLSANIMGEIQLIQGAIKGANHTETNNTMQCVLSKGDTYVTLPFYLNNNTFGSITNLKNHDGYINLVTGLTPREDGNYQQHIYSLTATLYDQLDIDRYESNVVKVIQQNSSPYGQDVLSDPDIRAISTLIGVVEGAPPCAISKEEDFTKLALFGVTPSLLTIGTDSRADLTHTNSYGGGINVSIGSEKEKVYSVTGGISYEATNSTAKIQTTTESLKLEFGSSQTSTEATFIYKVPKLQFYLYNIYSPDAETDIFDGMALETVLTAKEMITYTKTVPLSAPVFDVKNPLSVDSWAARDIDFNIATEPNSSIEKTFNYSIFNLYAQCTTQGSEATISNETREQERIYTTIKVGSNYFSTSSDLTFEQTVSSSNTLGNGVEMCYADISSYISGITPTAHSFQCTMYVLNEKHNLSKQHYYPAFKQMGLQLDSEKPFIVAYQVTNVHPYTATSALDISTRRSVYISHGKIMIDGHADRQFDIFDISGRLLTSGTVSSPSYTITLPKQGVYILKLENGEVYKLAI